LLETVSYILANGLESLVERYAIKAAWGRRSGNLVCLKYSQINSPMHEPIVRECRGLVLDEADGYRIVCRSFDKFFNFGEPNAAAIDWATAKVFEKLDGSLCSLYCYRDEWQVATTGTPDGAGQLNDTDTTFAALFWKTFKELGYRLPADSGPRANRIVYMFELMTPLNRIVVRHARPRLALIGVRDLDLGELEPEPLAQAMGWEVAQSFPLRCLEDCLSVCNQLDPMQAEGYVVCDSAFRRVKIKSPRYVALAHLKEVMSGRRLLEIARGNESGEFLTYFPEFADAFNRVNQEFVSLCDELEAAFVSIKHITDQKAFALEAGKTRCSAPLFSLRKGNCRTVREFFAKVNLAALERVLRVDLDSLVAGQEIES